MESISNITNFEFRKAKTSKSGCSNSLFFFQLTFDVFYLKLLVERILLHSMSSSVLVLWERHCHVFVTKLVPKHQVLAANRQSMLLGRVVSDSAETWFNTIRQKIRFSKYFGSIPNGSNSKEKQFFAIFAEIREMTIFFF